MLKKLLVSFLLGLTVFFSFVPYFSPTKAQTWYNQSFQEWYGKVYDPANPSEIFGERYTAAQVQWIIYSLFSYLVNSAVGPQSAGAVRCFLTNTADVSSCIQGVQDLLPTSAVITPNVAKESQNLWNLVFASDRPMSGISYVKEKLQNFNLVPVVHAAPTVGFGFTMLQPVQEMWTAFRNVAFGLFVIVAIVFAFMIMFRVKLSPQTVVSVQSALPKIVVALILVTFSYAIAGFLIDLMYVVIGMISIIGAPIVQLSNTVVFNFLTLGQPFAINIQLGMFGLFVLYLFFFTFCFFIVSIPMFGIIGIGLGATLSMIVFVILLLVTIFVGLKTLWSLLKAFAMIILLTIFAPIQIVLGTVVPNIGFGAWLKSYLASLSVFVVTGALMLFSFIFMFQAAGSVGSAFSENTLSAVLSWLLGGLVSNTFTGGSWPPLLGSTGVAPLYLGVSFVLFTLIPKANEIVQGFITGRPFAYGTAIGEAFGPVKQGAGMGMGYVSSQQQRIAKGEIESTTSSAATRARGYRRSRFADTLDQARGFFR
jgi:hypothetical protein